jgi:catechol 2,3-dioxygenase-like lactoylglutathione lyase family enzyme
MASVKIEHCAYQVEDPVAAAEWYTKHLGMVVKRAHTDRPWVRFMADDAGAVMLEFYNHPNAKLPDYRNQDPLIAHIAFKADDLAGTRDRLIAAGATLAADIAKTIDGDELVMLRDPWGLPIQFVKRVDPMI